jgi:hypothetical protein
MFTVLKQVKNLRSHFRDNWNVEKLMERRGISGRDDNRECLPIEAWNVEPAL